jgi:hypothetical protein
MSNCKCNGTITRLTRKSVLGEDKIIIECMKCHAKELVNGSVKDVEGQAEEIKPVPGNEQPAVD